MVKEYQKLVRLVGEDRARRWMRILRRRKLQRRASAAESRSSSSVHPHGRTSRRDADR